MDIANIKIYRITHIENVAYILKLGKLTTSNSPDADPNYQGIGESELIGLRSDHAISTYNSNIQVCPSCNYLPFYFAPRSVMLYRIQTGFKVAQIAPEHIVYFVYHLSDILADMEYLFTDGHGYAKLTQWFDDIAWIDRLDWDTIESNQWKSTEDDSDRQRRKQAEFWIKNEINLNKIKGIATFDEQTKEEVVALCTQYNQEIEVRVIPSYYY
jgi:hypothetical protein